MARHSDILKVQSICVAVAIALCGCGVKVDRNFDNPHDPANSSATQGGTTTPDGPNPESKTSVALKFGKNVKLTDGLRSLSSVVRVGDVIYFTGSYTNPQTDITYNVLGTVRNGIVDLTASTALSSDQISICDRCTNDISVILSNTPETGNLYVLNQASGSDSVMYEVDPRSMQAVSRIRGVDCYYYTTSPGVTLHFMSNDRFHKVNGSTDMTCGAVDGKKIEESELKDPHTKSSMSFAYFDSLILHEDKFYAYGNGKVQIYSASWDLEAIYSTAAYLYNGHNGRLGYQAFYLPGDPAYMFGCDQTDPYACYQTQVDEVQQ